jgi:hypothetical protein
LPDLRESDGILGGDDLRDALADVAGVREEQAPSGPDGDDPGGQAAALAWVDLAQVTGGRIDSESIYGRTLGW